MSTFAQNLISASGLERDWDNLKGKQLPKFSTFVSTAKVLDAVLGCYFKNASVCGFSVRRGLAAVKLYSDVYSFAKFDLKNSDWRDKVAMLSRGLSFVGNVEKVFAFQVPYFASIKNFDPIGGGCSFANLQNYSWVVGGGSPLKGQIKTALLFYSIVGSNVGSKNKVEKEVSGENTHVQKFFSSTPVRVIDHLYVGIVAEKVVPVVPSLKYAHIAWIVAPNVDYARQAVWSSYKNAR